MSYYARTTYTANGSTPTFSFSFPYISTSHVKAYVNGTEDTSITFPTSSSVTLSSTPANGATVLIKRISNPSARLVDFQDGSVLSASDLDQSANQNFFMAQETEDEVAGKLGVSTANVYDASATGSNLKISNVADPTANQDVVTKNYLTNTYLGASTITNINALSAKATQIGLLGTSDAIADMNTLGTADVVADMNTLANSGIVDDLNILATSDVVSDMNTLATSANVTAMGLLGTSANVTSMGLLGTSDAIADMNTLATSAIVTDMDLLATSANVTSMGNLGTSANVTNMATLGTSANVTNMATVAGKNTEIGLLGTSANATAIGLLGTSAVIADMNTLATSDIVSDLNTLASSGIVEDLNILATSANVTAMGLLGTSAVVTDMDLLGTSANVTNMANLGTSTNVTNMATLAGISGLSTLASNNANITTVATNIAGVNSFADRYRVQAGVPSSSLNVGDLNFDTTANELKVYKSSGWASAGSTVNGTSARFTYTATANQTTFTGADNNGSTLAYDASFIDCYLNGVKLVNGTDVTVTSGTSVVLATGATVGDTLDLVGFGTFNVASIAGTAINSGTINDARLPTTMAGKTLTTATVTGTINAETLIAKGDGSSADGKITLNCSQNSHGVKIQSPAHSAGQSYTLILPTSVGTSGQVLSSNGSSTNQLSWVDAVETKPTISSTSFTIAPSTTSTITIAGANFQSIPIVQFIKSDTNAVTTATIVAYTSASSLNATTNLATGSYRIRIENNDGNAVVTTNAIVTVSSAPSFSTAAGNIGTIAGNFSGTVFSLVGSSDSAVTFSEVTSGGNVLTAANGANCSLSTAGVITTTDFGGSSTTASTYTFDIRLTDAEGQTTDRQFSLTSSFGATGGGQFN